MSKEIPLSKLVKMSYDEIHEKDKFDLFFDWWCDDKALPNKSRRLMASVRSIVKTGTKMFDPDKTYVFFKNNYPCVGGLYDDLRICDIKTGAVLFNVCPRDPHSKNKPSVCFEGCWEHPIVFDSMKDVKAWFKDPNMFGAGFEGEGKHKLFVAKRKA